MGKKLDETKKLIREFEAKRAAELADIDSIVKELGEKMEEAKLHETLAVSSCNVTEYKIAKNEKSDIALQIELYKTRKAALEGGKLITEEEYTAQVEGVREEIRNSTRKYAEKLQKLYTEIGEAGEELKQLLKDADDTLQTLQSDIFRNGDRGRKDSNGRYEKPKVFSATNGAYEIAWEAVRRAADVSKTYAARYLANDFAGEPSLANYHIEH